MFTPMIRTIVTGLDNAFVNGKSIAYFRGVIDQFSKQEYLDLLEDFKKSKKESIRLSSFETQAKTGYSKFEIYKNRNYEVNMVEWDKNAKSLIHNHSPNGCVLKLIDGNLIEDSFTYPNTRKLENIKHVKRKILVPVHSFNKSNSHSYYMEGFHQISNINNGKSYSLHFYSPPNFIPTTL
tara:strand:+ start:4217 stop:4756 length:540 start_codon:yes stop_codon:yes gene_type:complete